MRRAAVTVRRVSRELVAPGADRAAPAKAGQAAPEVFVELGEDVVGARLVLELGEEEAVNFPAVRLVNDRRHAFHVAARPRFLREGFGRAIDVTHSPTPAANVPYARRGASAAQYSSDHVLVTTDLR